MSEKEDLINELEKMGDVCVNIVLVLYTHGKLRFNQLYRASREYGVLVSKPAFVENLRRLVKAKWVIRRKEGVQNVTYELNKDKAKVLENEVSPEEIERIFEELPKMGLKELKKVEYEALVSVSDRIKQLVRDFLEDFRAEIGFRLKCPKTSMLSKYLWFKNSYYRMLAEEIIQECLENIKFRVEVLREIDKFEKLLGKGDSIEG
jgi:DNA-binding HxlR family transcriptional regulator